ncbi:MAG: hypothetical protein LLH30_19125 [Candidatus Manganitrophus sp. SA1]|nr:hypothetical protein [Candidatus Manganitrophus morganii]
MDRGGPSTSLRTLGRMMRPWPRPKQLLVVETDGFGFRAGLVQAKGGKTSFECVVDSEAADPLAGLSDIVARLRQAGRELPKEAILLTPAVVPAVLQLPVAPTRPRPHAQMQEMIRWELEPFFIQRVGLWKLGIILVRRGYLSEDQMREIIQELERRKEEKHRSLGSQASTLFGEVAVEWGYITSEQRDACLKIQEQFQVTDEEMVCGWSPQPVPGELPKGLDERSGKEGGRYPWLVCGTSRAERSRWVALFQAQGFELKGIYPLVGCSAAVLSGSSAPSSALIEVRDGVMGCLRLSGERVQALQLYYAADRSFSEEAPLAWVGGEADTLYLSGQDHRIHPLSAALAALRQQETRFIPVEVEPSTLPHGMSAAALSGMLGAARHALRLPGGGRAVCVPAHDPGPPLRQRVGIWWVSAGLLALVIIGIVELSLAVRRQAARRHQAEALGTLNALKREGSAIQERQEAIKKVQRSLEERKQEWEEIAQRRTYLESELPGRVDRILSFLDRVAVALPKEMVLERITEEQGSFLIRGWSLSERAIQRFAEQLAVAMTPLGLKAVSLDVSAERGRLGLAGHAVTLRLAPIPPPIPPSVESNRSEEKG